MIFGLFYSSAHRLFYFWLNKSINTTKKKEWKAQKEWKEILQVLGSMEWSIQAGHAYGNASTDSRALYPVRISLGCNALCRAFFAYWLKKAGTSEYQQETTC